MRDKLSESFKKLWAMIPKAYRQHASFYTDQYVVYKGVIPAAQHYPIGKLARKTNHIELPVRSINFHFPEFPRFHRV